MTDHRESRLALMYAAFICRAPRLIILTAIAAAAASIWLTAQRLEFQASRTDLLSPKLEWNQRFNDWMDSFPGANDLMVVVASDPDDGPRRLAAMAFIDELVETLVADPAIASVEWGASPDGFTPKAVRLASMQTFERVIEEATDARMLLEHATPWRLLESINDRVTDNRSFGRAGPDAEPDEIAADIRRLDTLVTTIDAAFSRPDDAEPILLELLEDPTTEPWLYLESPTGRLIFVLVSPRQAADSINASQQAIVATRRIIEQVKAKHPGVEVGLTGTEVVDSDETEVATLDSTIASSISIALIAVLLVIAFHSLRMPLIVLFALLIGVAWSFGYLVLTVGHLQILSVVFIAVLLGLGVDFGIHLDSTFEQVRRDHPDGPVGFQPALADTLRLSAPGIMTGALTTAAAFLTTAFTDFKGVAEMGIIASGGVLLCLVSMFTVFPALLRLLRHSYRHVQPSAARKIVVFRDEWMLPVSRRPVWTLMLIAVVVGVAGWQATKLRFVYDLLALHPEGVESVDWQERVITDGGASIYFGVSITDNLDDAFALMDRYLELPTVAVVGGVGLCNPPDDARKIDMLRSARRSLEPAMNLATQDSPPTQTPSASTARFTTQLARLQRYVSEALKRRDVPPVIREGLVELGATLETAVAGFRSLEIAERVRHVEKLDPAWLVMRRTLAFRLEQLLDLSELTPSDFPPALMRPFVDASDPNEPRYCLHIYPSLPDDPGITNPLSPRFLPHFVSDLVSVDPEATGVVVQIQRSGELIWSSYRQAGLAAMIVVFILVWIVFRSVVDTVFALLPVVLSFLITFGIMSAYDVYLNPANLMVLPLLFGIGVDAGVHVVHRYRLNPTARPLGLTFGTGKGITLTSLTTMFGFATMMLARHHGVASLGFVMTVGLGMTTFVCWTALPALLELRQRRREKGA